ncbi:uncharacterized protein PGTG_21754 [Puccinia graminis f. sp. tritici CRL 75-36-700-3]|uniref:Uncharacterized protein n=1 Tax=Puccinia graminis f. sp. tritici (strain CRL 75-36-700-3 / race SCCL) TaxID=418459 RepID=H6QSD7_PUCGT|nr:uncharacterized protein PGTG_21754 [Puccinia graminis f. sp. tritici CRL 75-36-700-3]EHS63668.1 hypothetical protein PGTG_21754 [Puccinia graminis f. sp. tritici CRL 75-36-700-3]
MLFVTAGSVVVVIIDIHKKKVTKVIKSRDASTLENQIKALEAQHKEDMAKLEAQLEAQRIALEAQRIALEALKAQLSSI